jgi:hypothetical protein
MVALFRALSADCAIPIMPWRQDADHVLPDRRMGPIFSCSTYVHIKAKL